MLRISVGGIILGELFILTYFTLKTILPQYHFQENGIKYSIHLPPLFPPQLYHYLTLCERGKIAELWISFGTLVSLMCLTRIYSYSCLTLRDREGATLTAIGIDRFSAVWPREEIGQGHFYLQREAENILRGLSRWIGQTHKQAQMRD